MKSLNLPPINSFVYKTCSAMSPALLLGQPALAPANCTTTNTENFCCITQYTKQVVGVIDRFVATVNTIMYVGPKMPGGDR